MRGLLTGCIPCAQGSKVGSRHGFTVQPTFQMRGCLELRSCSAGPKARRRELTTCPLVGKSNVNGWVTNYMMFLMG